VLSFFIFVEPYSANSGIYVTHPFPVTENKKQ